MLVGDGCSAIRGLFLIHDLLLYVVPWYKQTGSDSCWLQSQPGGRNTAGLARGPRVQFSAARRGGGRADAGGSEQVAS